MKSMELSSYTAVGGETDKFEKNQGWSHGDGSAKAKKSQYLLHFIRTICFLMLQ